MSDNDNTPKYPNLIPFPRRRKSPHVTYDMAVMIHKLREVGLFQHQIAAYFGVNPGRVCEVLKGDKYPDLLKQGSLF
jgi:hypothetical protein